jgi:hypothetical protein
MSPSLLVVCTERRMLRTHFHLLESKAREAQDVGDSGERDSGVGGKTADKSCALRKACAKNGKGKKTLGNKRTARANPVSLGVHKMGLDSDISGSVEGEDKFDKGASHSDLSDNAMSYNASAGGQESEDKLLHTISSGFVSKAKLKGALVKEVSCMVHWRPLY